MTNPYPISRESREEVIFRGDGTASYGPFDLKVFDILDVDVWTRADDAATWSQASPTVTKTTGLALDTFSIAFPANIPSTVRIKVQSKRVHERTAGVINGTRIDPDALEKELSKLATALQELRRDVDRGISVQFGSGYVMSDDLEDGDTVMVSGDRMVAGPNASDIALAQGYAEVAEAAKGSAEEALAEFLKRYLGSFANDTAATAAPGTRFEGQLYFRTSDDIMRVYRSGSWTSAEGIQGPQGDPGIQGIQGERDTRNFCWAGSFDWWRPRGTSVASTAGRILTADGWTIGRSSGDTGVTVSKQQGSRTNNACARVQRNSGNTATTQISFVHNMSPADSVPLAGKPFTLTFRARKGANFSGQLFAALKCTNSLTLQTIALTNGNYSVGDASVASTEAVLTTSWQTFTIAGTFPSDLTQAAIRFQHVPTGTAGAADYFEVEEVQLELGSTASDFVPVDPDYALMKAERQFWKTYDNNVAPGTAANYAGSKRLTSNGTAIATAAVFSLDYPEMLYTPTITAYSPQTGASAKMAQGSTADIDITVSHPGLRGAGVANAVTAVASALYYLHATVEARL